MTSARQRPVLGIFWMFVTGLCFVAVTAIVKYMGSDVPPAQAAFLRYVLGLVFLIPFWRVLKETRITPRQWRLFTFRGLMHGGAVILWFFAMTRIPLAELTAMNYLAPVYVTLGAALFLGERLAARRIIAVVMALIGTAIILRPGFREVSPGHLAMLLAAVAFAGSYLITKLLADEVPATLVVAVLSVTVTIVLTPFAIAQWVPPKPVDIALLFCVASFATLGHYTMTLALAAAPVMVTQPITFLQLVWAMLLGALAFGEPVDSFVVIGGLIIIGAVSYITWREAVVARREITPPSPAMKT